MTAKSLSIKGAERKPGGRARKGAGITSGGLRRVPETGLRGADVSRGDSVRWAATRSGGLKSHWCSDGETISKGGGNASPASMSIEKGRVSTARWNPKDPQSRAGAPSVLERVRQVAGNIPSCASVSSPKVAAGCSSPAPHVRICGGGAPQWAFLLQQDWGAYLPFPRRPARPDS